MTTFERVKHGIQQARDPEIIMALLGIAQAVGISSALILADGEAADMLTRVFSFVRGSTMGAALSFGLMGVSHQAPRMKAKQAQNIAYAMLLALLVVSPIIIAPAVHAGIPARILAGPLAWVWAAAIAVAPDFVAVAIAVVSKGVIEVPAQVPAQSAKSAEVPAQVPAPSRTRCEVPGCKMDYSTIGGKGGHYKKHHKDLINK